MDFWFPLNNPIKPGSVHDKISCFVVVNKGQGPFLFCQEPITIIFETADCEKVQATIVIFRGKSLSKNKLTCENAIARIYGSCTLRVMGSCFCFIYFPSSSSAFKMSSCILGPITSIAFGSAQFQGLFCSGAQHSQQSYPWLLSPAPRDNVHIIFMLFNACLPNSNPGSRAQQSQGHSFRCLIAQSRFLSKHGFSTLC